MPKLSVVATRPLPNTWCQMRFTITRAVSGFSGDTSQRASARRFGVEEFEDEDENDDEDEVCAALSVIPPIRRIA